MSDLFKAFEKFLFRDMSFLLGGSVVVASGMYVFNGLPTGDVLAFEYFIGAGVAYAVGYSVQEVFTLLRIVRTKAGYSPNWLSSSLYHLFDRRRAVQVDPREYQEAKRWLYEQAPQRFRDDHERTEALKQVGTTLGPCFFLSGVILLGKDVLLRLEYESAVSWGFVVLGLVLFLLGWLKVTQQAQYLIARFRAGRGPGGGQS